VRASPQAFILLSFRISLNDHDPPPAATVLFSAAIQIVSECGQCLGCNLYYVVIRRRPAISVPLLRIRGFSMIISVITIGVWCSCVDSVLPACLGRRAESNANWAFLTDALVDDLNTSALCEAFPEAVHFAREQC
jgi:hypothetical protein